MGCLAKSRAQRARTKRARGHTSRAWERASRAYRREHPYCEDESHVHEPELLRPASAHVDHIDGLGPNGPRGFDDTNLRALCVPCHSRHTGRDYGFGSR